MMTADVQENYEVHIGAFEGPLDLLLYLVQKNEVAPKDVSISEITDQYLAWIKDLSQADLSAAGDFLLMASRLMALKVRELLPKDQQTPEEQEERDLEHEELIRQMMEYARYKQVAKELQGKEAENFCTFYRGRLEKTQSDDDTLADANVWQLFRAFQKSLKSRGHESVHHVELDYVTIEDRQQFISNYLAKNGRGLFEDLLGDDPHPILAAVTFMALMEMIKTDEVVFRQGELLGPIWVYRRKNNPEFAEEMANEVIRYAPEKEYKDGLIETLRERELVRANHKIPSIDAVMRSAAMMAAQGRSVNDEDIMAMLEGRMELAVGAEDAEHPAVQNARDMPLDADGSVSVPPLDSVADPCSAQDDGVAERPSPGVLQNALNAGSVSGSADDTDAAVPDEKEYDDDLLDVYAAESSVPEEEPLAHPEAVPDVQPGVPSEDLQPGDLPMPTDSAEDSEDGPGHPANP